jgi:hypothetical protein
MKHMKHRPLQPLPSPSCMPSRLPRTRHAWFGFALLAASCSWSEKAFEPPGLSQEVSSAEPIDTVPPAGPSTASQPATQPLPEPATSVSEGQPETPVLVTPPPSGQGSSASGGQATECGTGCEGSCTECDAGVGGCTSNNDCASRLCANGRCSEATCADGVQNQGETAVDCGGPCPRCLAGSACNVANECFSTVCGTANCPAGVARCCQLPTCSDGAQNGFETGEDCGGACTPCPGAPPCGPFGCGTGNQSCQRCAIGGLCLANSDCGSGLCVFGRCASSCGDGVMNGLETGLDCGGPCGACAPGLGCVLDADCQRGACVNGTCCGGSGVDCTRCAERLAPTARCSQAMDPFGISNCEALLSCFTANPTACPTRGAPGCTDALGVCDWNNFGGVGGSAMLAADRVLSDAGCALF